MFTFKKLLLTRNALCIGVGIMMSLVLPISTFADAVWIDGSDVGGIPSSNISIDDLQVDADDPEEIVPVSLYVPSGTLQMSTTTGLTFTGASSGSQLYFSGTETDVNAALATLTYTNGSVGTFTLEANIVAPGQVYNPGTGHVYEVVNHGGAISAGAARSAALARSINGVSGYLANITSSDENNFISARLSSDGWFGASDASSEGNWIWLDGPEAGTTFWVGTSGGTAFGYENWAAGEPNQSGDEDCSVFYANGSGWNDLSCSGAVSSYVVEYGAPGETATIASSTLDIDVEADITPPIAPTIVAPSLINDQYPTISGTCEPDATVSISIEPTEEERDVVCDEEGEYSITPNTAIPYGIYTVTAFQTDPALNVGPSEDVEGELILYGAGGGTGGGALPIVEPKDTEEEVPIVETKHEPEDRDVLERNILAPEPMPSNEEKNYEIKDLTEEMDILILDSAEEEPVPVIEEEIEEIEMDEEGIKDEYHYRFCEMGTDLLAFVDFELNGICEGFFKAQDLIESEYYQQEVTRKNILSVAIAMLRDNPHKNPEAVEHTFYDVSYTGEDPQLFLDTKVGVYYNLITPNRHIFEPERPVMRAEAYAMIMSTVCLYPEGSDEDSWQQKVHNIAYKEGITQFDWDEYQPERHILQQELFVLVSRVADWAEQTGGCRPRK